MIDIPTLRFRPNKSPARVMFGFPWIYSDDVILDRRTKKIPPGTFVKIQTNDKQDIGLIAFNSESKITGRIMDLDVNATIDTNWIVKKLESALALRKTLYDAPFYRLIHAEADGLPGVIIDRFGDAFVVQPNAAWADRMMPEITSALEQLFSPNIILKNASGRARSLEGLNDENIFIKGSSDAPLEVKMNDAIYMADISGGQKTGLFFDQRENHAFTAKLANGGSIIDVFSHVGGFSLAALSAGATSATAVDSSQPALDLAIKGADASGFSKSFSTHKGDAFEVMAQLFEEGERYQVVVCDPPAFAPSKPALERGLRAYEKAAKMASKLVKPGGYLVLCSCSHAADMQKFRKASLVGMGKAGRKGQIIHSGSAGIDHPVHPHLAESSYLKSIFLRLD
ncbi:class I SAM-dependent rRNA methyltransferase [Amylibacter sp.]|jgi:23S rRNA (cytosine1962-C5)-methyltransferase|nr:class I SAM-dependent rRNA methyltransferase [Amylibacter sp.]MDA7759321.1 class I SAM-dependent rRNA methyltransferase [Amylibacter sp.]MDA7846873.1 class I SAM-dependent rRNA methyltransferase [Amylibacter sp.]MDA9534442.1 class I SAM-dependent rRNA methyltransferase [Amylibacter sp.]MDA9772295.1 class I SAM-dependent rRNA methyltransferase [Amylibacter sp.]|tara:strand:- start:2569 stop:3759 length:1191 start_codon:yes stop_codon:yes gene_type:complete